MIRKSRPGAQPFPRQDPDRFHRRRDLTLCECQNSIPIFARALNSRLRRRFRISNSSIRSSVAATADIDTLRTQIVKPLARAGVSSAQVIEELVRDVQGGLLGS